MDHKIKITATTAKRFLEIEEALKTLSESVYVQIEAASIGIVGIECIIKYEFKKEQNIFVPSDVKQIKHFGDYIGIYTDKFFFRIEGKLAECNLSYIIEK